MISFQKHPNLWRMLLAAAIVVFPGKEAFAQSAENASGNRPVNYVSGSLRLRQIETGFSPESQERLEGDISLNRYWPVRPWLNLGFEGHLAGVKGASGPVYGNVFFGPSVQIQKTVSGSLMAFVRTGAIGSSNKEMTVTPKYSSIRSPFINTQNYIYGGAGLEWSLDEVFGLYVYAQYSRLDFGFSPAKFENTGYKTRGLHLSIGISFR